MKVMRAEGGHLKTNARYETVLPLETELEMARRHVAEGERHVRLQEQIIAHLQGLGADTTIAQQLKGQFEELLVMHRQHLAKLERPLSR